MSTIEPHRFPNMFITTSPEEPFHVLCTVNYAPNIPEVFDFDEIVTINGTEYRKWRVDCRLAASIVSGLHFMSVKPGGKILCIDVAPITLSFISDIISTSGKVYCVNSSESDYQIVAKLQSQRNNLIAISGSANNPSEYQSEIPEKVDIIMTNGTHKAMTENAKLFLKEGGDFYIVLHKPEGYVQQSVEWTQETITDVKKYFKPRELLTLEPFSNTDAVFVGTSFCNVE